MSRWMLFAIIPCIAASRAAADTFGSGANQYTIDFVTIGQPGNPADTTGTPFIAGSVPYVYRIGKYEISEQMIDKANSLGSLGITKTLRGPNKPATQISWLEAAQFVNWLNASTGKSVAYKFDADGNLAHWLPSDPGYNAGNLLRNGLSKYFLPSVDEWYKAAYYDPAQGVYYDYPTGSDSVPDGIDFSGDATFDAVFGDGGGNPQPNDLTNVGLLSPFGTAGQGGNVGEWNEGEAPRPQIPSLLAHSFRGGDWEAPTNNLRSSVLFSGSINSAAFFQVGLRVAASVPEPTTAHAIAVTLLLLEMAPRWKRRQTKFAGGTAVAVVPPLVPSYSRWVAAASDPPNILRVRDSRRESPT